MEKRINKPADGDDKVRKHRKVQRKKVCQFCVDKNKDIDYKETTKLKRFITEKGKIIPRRTSGTCAEHQRQLTLAIKKARIMALLPFKAE
ncbi:MAG: 30S ribosomal protein S18 [Firmicutes bacterium]|nr:30S ribosomal protein S18 [Bacillota bacterium]